MAVAEFETMCAWKKKKFINDEKVAIKKDMISSREPDSL